MAEARVPEALVYPGAPLRAVAIEVRFPALLDAVNRFAAFQRRHLAVYDRLYEASGDQDAPDGREFSRPNSLVLMGRDRAVSIARDQLAAVTYPYQGGFPGFAEWALPTLREGLGDLGVERIAAVSYRYENRIQHDTRDIEIGRLLKLSLSAPTEAEPGLQHVHLYWHQKWPGGRVQVEFEACPTVSTDELHLNITAHCSAPTGSLDEMEALVRESHRRARLTFEELITPAFREYLKKPEGGFQ